MTGHKKSNKNRKQKQKQPIEHKTESKSKNRKQSIKRSPSPVGSSPGFRTTALSIISVKAAASAAKGALDSEPPTAVAFGGGDLPTGGKSTFSVDGGIGSVETAFGNGGGGFGCTFAAALGAGLPRSCRSSLSASKFGRVLGRGGGGGLFGFAAFGLYT